MVKEKRTLKNDRVTPERTQRSSRHFWLTGLLNRGAALSHVGFFCCFAMVVVLHLRPWDCESVYPFFLTAVYTHLNRTLIPSVLSPCRECGPERIKLTLFIKSQCLSDLLNYLQW